MINSASHDHVHTAPHAATVNEQRDHHSRSAAQPRPRSVHAVKSARDATTSAQNLARLSFNASGWLKTCALAALLPVAAAQEVPSEPHDGVYILFACLIPILVLLSGVVAGLTLGYLSLDTTVLEVLAKTGTPKQKARALAILPIRRNGHLLLVSLLITNMVINETLPIISDKVLGGGVQAVAVSTVLVIIFAEIIPQSLCTRFGLVIGATMVWPTRFVIALTYVVSKPTSMLLEWILGAHSGVVYRRAELKELIAMHQITGEHGGDLQRDTAFIVGNTLDLQVKSARDAMTALSDVYMLDADHTLLDYPTLRKILEAGHSRIPVFELSQTKQRRIIGCLIVKQLVMIDPEDAMPLRSVPIHPLPFVSDKLPLLELLNVFQTGRSHMAVVAPRLAGFGRVGSTLSTRSTAQVPAETETHKDRSSLLKSLFKRESNEKDGLASAENGEVKPVSEKKGIARSPRGSMSAVPLDHDSPIGIITLEDVIEELIGEEIFDETDSQGEVTRALDVYLPPEALAAMEGHTPTPPVQAPVQAKTSMPALASRPSNLLSSAAAALGLPRPRSTPGRSRSVDPGLHTTPIAPLTSSVPTATPLVAEPEALPNLAEHVTNASGEEAQTEPTSRDELATPVVAGDEAALPPPVRVPSKLADAVLFERGRRQLVHQGVDPAAINVRIANTIMSAPGTSASVPNTPMLGGGSTGGRLMSVAAPAPSHPGNRNKSFKTPASAQLPSPPMRQQPAPGSLPPPETHFSPDPPPVTSDASRS